MQCFVVSLQSSFEMKYNQRFIVSHVWSPVYLQNYAFFRLVSISYTYVASKEYLCSLVASYAEFQLIVGYRWIIKPQQITSLRVAILHHGCR